MGEIGPDFLFGLQLFDEDLVDTVALPLRPLGQLIFPLETRPVVELDQHRLFHAVDQLLPALESSPTSEINVQIKNDE